MSMIDSSTLPPFIEAKGEQLECLCREFSVLRLELFGSAADGTFDPERSDLDFLVEFERSPRMNAFHQFFGFEIALSDLFERKIDLVAANAMSNPYFIDSVNRSRKLLYAA
jgi:predicted nucleotidyltransferase